MNIDLFLLYCAVAFFYVISPGPAVLLAIINGLRANMKVVFLSSFANVLGLFILSTASILGLGVVITTSATLFLIIKVVGAFYLLYLGYKFLSNKSSLVISEDESILEKRTNKSYFYESFILAVTNPKPILFFTAIFPQFIDVKFSLLPQFLMMTGVFLFISFTSLCSYAYLSKRSRAYLSNKKATTWFNRITGGIFVTMGVGLLQLRNQNN